jgi:endonuclease G
MASLRLVDLPQHRKFLASLLLAAATAACATGAPSAPANTGAPSSAYELAAAPPRLYSFHCVDGACPAGARGDNALVVREIYALSSNKDTKLADWVAYVVTPSTIGPSQSRSWAADPWLPEDETLEPADYGGANAALGTDRGHQAPLAAFSGTPHWPATNFLSNITPQMAGLNQGPWERLERRERDLALSGAIVHVLTGPLFERDMAPLPGADESHVVPSGYWKVVVVGDEAAAFIFDQSTPRDASICDHAADLGEVQTRTGLTLFPGRIRQFSPLSGRLGCAPD